MACGTRVVWFKVGGIPEMIEEGQTGLLATRGNIQELARAISFLLDHERECSAMAKQARKRVEEQFSRHGQVEKYLPLYSRLLAARGGNIRVSNQYVSCARYVGRLAHSLKLGHCSRSAWTGRPLRKDPEYDRGCSHAVRENHGSHLRRPVCAEPFRGSVFRRGFYTLRLRRAGV